MTATTYFQPVTSADVPASVARDLRRNLGGRVWLPGENGYDDARRTWNGAADLRPAVVAEATTAADVRVALHAARAHDLPFAVQGAGHGTYGYEPGVLLRTSAMTTVLVDPDRQVARVGPGARWRDVIAAAAPFGLAPLSGSAPGVGVAGYTLGGGFGWLARKYGFAADSLLRADLVTADGRALTATRDHNADLFWAIRGGSGNFGVVTSLEFRLYPVPTVYSGTAYFAVDRAADVLARYRDWAATAQPDELSTAIVLMREAPQETGVPGPVLAVRGLYLGSAVEARRAMRPLWNVAGEPLGGGFRPSGYAEAGGVGGTPARQFALYDALTEGVIEAALEVAGRPDSPAATAEVRYWGGAIADAGADAGPAGHREVPFSITVNGSTDAVESLNRHATGGSFLNFLGDTSRTHTAYTARNFLRLREIKRAYDPENFFNANHNIAPARGL